ncbi:MAG: saccharopine dehydrogenase family protein [Anaerolineales bacterium]
MVEIKTFLNGYNTVARCKRGQVSKIGGWVGCTPHPTPNFRPHLTRMSGSKQTDKVSCVQLDANDHEQVAKWMRLVQAVVVLLPRAFRSPMARLAVENGIHFVDASYAHPDYKHLHGPASEKGIAILPEFGLDPGIDHVLAAKALAEFDEVHEFHSYGAGIPEPAAANNPLRYKISWTFAGVLNSYRRSGVVWREGQPQHISPSELFDPANVHLIDVEGFGPLEAYPNGDVVKYLEMLGIAGQVKNAGRYTARWPGHTEFWGRLNALGFLDDDPITVGGQRVSPRQFLHDLLVPQLQYGEDERDAVIIRVDVSGLVNGQRKRIVYQMVDYRDLSTGLLAMQRTVGYTAAIGAQMILRGDIQKRGLLSPLTDVPFEIFLDELTQRGIRVTTPSKDAGLREQ